MPTRTSSWWPAWPAWSTLLGNLASFQRQSVQHPKWFAPPPRAESAPVSSSDHRDWQALPAPMVLLLAAALTTPSTPGCMLLATVCRRWRTATAGLQLAICRGAGSTSNEEMVASLCRWLPNNLHQLHSIQFEPDRLQYGRYFAQFLQDAVSQVAAGGQLNLPLEHLALHCYWETWEELLPLLPNLRSVHAVFTANAIVTRVMWEETRHPFRNHANLRHLSLEVIAVDRSQMPNVNPVRVILSDLAPPQLQSLRLVAKPSADDPWLQGVLPLGACRHLTQLTQLTLQNFLVTLGEGSSSSSSSSSGSSSGAEPSLGDPWSTLPALKELRLDWQGHPVTEHTTLVLLAPRLLHLGVPLSVVPNLALDSFSQLTSLALTSPPATQQQQGQAGIGEEGSSSGVSGAAWDLTHLPHLKRLALPALYQQQQQQPHPTGLPLHLLQQCSGLRGLQELRLVVDLYRPADMDRIAALTQLTSLELTWSHQMVSDAGPEQQLYGCPDPDELQARKQPPPWEPWAAAVVQLKGLRRLALPVPLLCCDTPWLIMCTGLTELVVDYQPVVPQSAQHQPYIQVKQALQHLQSGGQHLQRVVCVGAEYACEGFLYAAVRAVVPWVSVEVTMATHAMM